MSHSVFNFLWIISIALFLISCSREESFLLEEDPNLFVDDSTSVPLTVVAYNVENLFDIDGQAIFNDYKPQTVDRPNGYTATKFLTKLENISYILSTINKGEGPEIILFQELEADQTPEGWHGDLRRFLYENPEVTVRDMLTSNRSAQFKQVPAEAWLWRILFEAGLGEYFVAVGDSYPDPLGYSFPHVNATFSKFPITNSITHKTAGGRGILEVKIEIGEIPLIIFNNHWKAGASSEESELIRTGNARVLRSRIDELLAEDSYYDFIIGGDLNSHYNQTNLFPSMKRTGINDVLKSKGNEIGLISDPEIDLYNLWFELPFDQRYSEIFKGHHSTLMHLIIPQGLYDYKGIQYIDNSFKVLSLPGVNTDKITGIPIRWNNQKNGYGFSDHLPILAKFKTIPFTVQKRKVFLDNPSYEPTPPSRPVKLDYAHMNLAMAQSTNKIPMHTPLQSSYFYNKVLLVDSIVVSTKPFQIKVHNETFTIWSPNKKLLNKITSTYIKDDSLYFYGQLNQHKGKWQFVIQHPTWLDPGLFLQSNSKGKKQTAEHN
ncbi:MAG: hypothetical protein AAGA18_06850 [Verrucomicrobiota bacterium]